MLPLDAIAIEQEARHMRTIEMQRMYGQLGKRLRISGGVLANHARAGLIALGGALHSLSSRIQHSAVRKVANGHWSRAGALGRPLQAPAMPVSGPAERPIPRRR